MSDDRPQAAPAREPLPPVVVLIALLLIAWGSQSLLGYLADGVEPFFPGPDTPTLASHFQGAGLFVTPLGLLIMAGQLLAGIALLRRAVWARKATVFVLLAMLAMGLYGCVNTLRVIPMRLAIAAELAQRPEIAAWLAERKAVDEWNATYVKDNSLRFDGTAVPLKKYPETPAIVIEHIDGMHPPRAIIIQQTLEFLGHCAQPLLLVVLLALLLQPTVRRWRWLTFPHVPAVAAGVALFLASLAWQWVISSLVGINYRLVERNLYNILFPWSQTSDHLNGSVMMLVFAAGVLTLIIAYLWRQSRLTTWLLKAGIVSLFALALVAIASAVYSIRYDLQSREQLLRLYASLQRIQKIHPEPMPESLQKYIRETPTVPNIYFTRISESVEGIPDLFLYLMLFRLLPLPKRQDEPSEETDTVPGDPPAPPGDDEGLS